MNDFILRRTLGKPFRIGLYPDVSNSGIGTYISNISKYLAIDRIKSKYNQLSPLQFIFGYPVGYDLIHIPHFVVPLRKRGTKIVCTIQDVTPLVIDGLFHPLQVSYLRFRIWWSIKYADYLIFTSHNTYADSVRLFGKISRFKIIPLGVGDAISESQLPIVQYKAPYFLCVGRRRHHKNIHGIIQAFASIQHQTAAILIFAGAQDIFDAKYVEMAKSLGIQDKVFFIGSLSEEQLASHYKGALALLFPSLYEGFGLPILEAMSYGCPVITSNMSSMPEVGGSAALYVDPSNINDLAEKMHLVESSSNLRDQLRVLGLNRVKEFSWRKTAEKTMEVYAETLGVEVVELS